MPAQRPRKQINTAIQMKERREETCKFPLCLPCLHSPGFFFTPFFCMYVQNLCSANQKVQVLDMLRCFESCLLTLPCFLFVKSAFSEHRGLNIDRFPSVGHFPVDGTHKIHTRTQIKKKQVKRFLLLVDNKEAVGHMWCVFMCASNWSICQEKLWGDLFWKRQNKKKRRKKEVFYVTFIHSIRSSYNIYTTVKKPKT